MAYYGDYYRGDYYRGDYYRGDPLFGAVLGGVAKLGVGLVKKGVGALIGKKAASTAVTVGGGVATGMILDKVTSPPPIIVGPGIIPPLPPPTGPTDVAPQGMKVVKTKGIKGAVQRILPGGATGYEYKRRRRMNVTNSKALRRAIRRATGFAKLARKVLTFVSPRAPKGKAIFKRGRKR